jgi:transposase
MNTGKRKRYDDDFKREAMKLVTEQGMRIGDVAKDLGVTAWTLGRWLKESGYSCHDSRKKILSKAEEQARIKELEKALKRVTMERDILKKAIAYFTETPK